MNIAAVVYTKFLVNIAIGVSFFMWMVWSNAEQSHVPAPSEVHPAAVRMMDKCETLSQGEIPGHVVFSTVHGFRYGGPGMVKVALDSSNHIDTLAFCR